MSDIHFIFQGKGGVGKTILSTILLQYFNETGRKTVGFDCDPVNATFAGYSSLDIKEANLMDSQNVEVNARKFDDIMEFIMNECSETTVVIDSGASVFLPFTAYLKENEALELLAANGFSIFLHTIITGGQGLVDTLNGLKTLAQSFGDEPCTRNVWLNEFFGPIWMDNKSFEEFKAYKENADKIDRIIRIPHKSSGTFGKDLCDLFTNKMTFSDAAKSNSIHAMPKNRINKFWSEMKQTIDQSFPEFSEK